MHYSLCCMDYYKYMYEITIKVLCMCKRMYTNMNEWLTVKDLTFYIQICMKTYTIMISLDQL